MLSCLAPCMSGSLRYSFHGPLNILSMLPNQRFVSASYVPRDLRPAPAATYKCIFNNMHALTCRHAVAQRHSELQRAGEMRGVRVLVVGAGTGLVTLLAARCVHQMKHPVPYNYLLYLTQSKLTDSHNHAVVW